MTPAVAAAASTGTNFSTGPDAARFVEWQAERAQLEQVLQDTPEWNEALHDRLLERSFQLERLILQTPSLELPAIQVKARVVLWLMEMEDADAVPAMRQIRAFLER